MQKEEKHGSVTIVKENAMKKFVLMLMIAILVLTSCGSKPEESSLVSYGTEVFDSGIFYDEFIGGCPGADGEVYLAVRLDIEGDDGWDFQHLIYRIAEDGRPHLLLSSDSYWKDSAHNETVQVEALQPGDNSLWITGRTFFDGASHNFLWHVDQEGEELSRIDLNGAKEELSIEKIEDSMVDNDNWLYIISGGTVYVLNYQQEYQFTLEAGEGVDLVRLSSGQPGFFINGTNELRTVDKEAQDWGDVYKLPENTGTLYPGNSQYLFFCNADGVLNGWDTESGSLVPLVDWLAAGIRSSTVEGFSIQADGKIIGALREDGVPQVAVLTPGGKNVEKTVLTLSGISGNYYISKYISEFNRTSDTCRIVYKTYYTQTGDYFSPDEYLQARKRLMTEIGAGDIPDLLDIERMPFQRYGALGILEDLWPYIENDPELGREGVMEHVLECAEVNGKLYIVFNEFYIETLAGAKAVVGDRTGWTFSDLRAALETMPEGCSVLWPETTKNELLKAMISADLDNYIDWETGTCFFDCEEFQDILSFCNTAGAEAGDRDAWYTMSADRLDPQRLYTLIAEGEMMLYPCGVGNFLRVQEEKQIFGGEVSYVGHPTGNGTCGSSFSVLASAAMTSACKDKESGWEFLRQFLLVQPKLNTDLDYFNTRFPVNRKGFEYLREKSMTPDYSEDGKELPKFVNAGIPNFDADDVSYYAITQEQYDQVMQLYNDTNTIYWNDDDLWEIVSEQAQAYFAGDRSLAETVGLIQDRAELYVNERT